MIQFDEHIFQMALKPPSLCFNGSFWLPVDWYAASWEDASWPCQLACCRYENSVNSCKIQEIYTPGNDHVSFSRPALLSRWFSELPVRWVRCDCSLEGILKTNISPENQWLEGEISFWNGPFSRDMLIFTGGNILAEYRDVGQEILRAEDWDLLRNPMEQRPSRLSGETQSDYFGNVMCKCWKPP